MGKDSLDIRRWCKHIIVGERREISEERRGEGEGMGISARGLGMFRFETVSLHLSLTSSFYPS